MHLVLERGKFLMNQMYTINMAAKQTAKFQMNETYCHSISAEETAEF